MQTKLVNKIVSLLALVGVLLAWYGGTLREEKGIVSRLREIIPADLVLEQQSEKRFVMSQNNIYFQAALGNSRGYEGPLNCLLVSDSLGVITSIWVVDHTETPSYFKKVDRAKYLDHFIGQSVEKLVNKENFPDAVSGATYTSLAIQKAVMNASVILAQDVFQIAVPEVEQAKVQIGFLEILLVIFLISVIVTRKLKPKLKIRVRTGLLIASVLTLGFFYNFHLTISRFNTLILGYWPDFYQNLSWYILVFGVLGMTLVSGRNPYCHWFCPFGAIQEGIGIIKKTSWRIPLKFKKFLVWLPRMGAWIAILIALYLRNPGYTSYEPFGMFFSLTGPRLLFGITVVVLVLSLFIKRPWCEFACPVPPVIDYLLFWRKLFKTGIKNK